MIAEKTPDRFLSGVLLLAYRTKSVCKNPYNTSKYLVL